MASDPMARRAAVRELLVEQVARTARPAAATPTRPRPAEPGRVRMALVTGAVAAAVVAATLLVLRLPHHADGRVSGPPATTHASATPAPTATAPSGRALVAPDGWHALTRPELHAYVVGSPIFQGDAANAAIWEEQAWLDVGCMATKGYLYDPVAQAEDPGARLAGLTAAQAAGFEVAMYGPATSEPYDWRTAGCHGRSVHVTGQDHAN